jgi:hypothetical protein
LTIYSIQEPIGIRTAQTGLMVLSAAIGAWLFVDTRRAMRLMTRWLSWGRRPNGKPMWEKAGWVWFYRLDGAVVLIGVIYMLVWGQLLQ